MRACMRTGASKHSLAHMSQSVSFLYIIIFHQLDLLDWADFNTILIMIACLICSIVLKSTAAKLYILISVNSQHTSQASPTGSFSYDPYSIIYRVMKSKTLLLPLLCSMPRDSLHIRLLEYKLLNLIILYFLKQTEQITSLN